MEFGFMNNERRADLCEECLTRLLLNALKQFYQVDAKDMFTARIVDERAMVGCIARYTWNLHNQYCKCTPGIDVECLFPHVDTEYDLMVSKNGIPDTKSFDFVDECQDQECYEKCAKLIADKASQDCPYSGDESVCENKGVHKRFRPDLIVHRRNCLGDDNGNGLFVEFKKYGSSVNNRAFDMAKVKFCTCSKRPFKYLLGAFVMLNKDDFQVTFFKNGEIKNRLIKGGEMI